MKYQGLGHLKHLDLTSWTVNQTGNNSWVGFFPPIKEPESLTSVQKLRKTSGTWKSQMRPVTVSWIESLSGDSGWDIFKPKKGSPLRTLPQNHLFSRLGPQEVRNQDCFFPSCLLMVPRRQLLRLLKIYIYPGTHTILRRDHLFSN